MCSFRGGSLPTLRWACFILNRKKLFQAETHAHRAMWELGHVAGEEALNFFCSLLKELELDLIQWPISKNAQMIFKNEVKSKLSAQAAEDCSCLWWIFSPFMCEE